MVKETLSNTKIKCNYHLTPNTKNAIDTLHRETGIARGVILDVLVAHYGVEIKKIFMKGEPQSIVGVGTYSAE